MLSSEGSVKLAVRVSREHFREIEKRGRVSDVVREALDAYFSEGEQPKPAKKKVISGQPANVGLAGGFIWRGTEHDPRCPCMMCEDERGR